MKFIEDHPEFNWNWGGVSRNPNITMEFIESHPEFNWNWYEISRNSNITMEFIETHPEFNWDWYAISENEFTRSKELFMIEEARKYMAIYKIKKWWKKIYDSPYTEVGKRQINKSYDDLFKN